MASEHEGVDVYSSPEQIHATADRIAGLAGEFWDDVSEVAREVDDLMRGDWTGEAAGTHAPLWDEWLQSARKITLVLNEDAELLHHTAEQFTATDDGNAANITAEHAGLEL